MFIFIVFYFILDLITFHVRWAPDGLCAQLQLQTHHRAADTVRWAVFTGHQANNTQQNTHIILAAFQQQISLW